MPKVIIEESYDGFDIVVGEKRYHFDQEDSKKKMVAVFKSLGIKAIYKEIY